VAIDVLQDKGHTYRLDREMYCNIMYDEMITTSAGAWWSRAQLKRLRIIINILFSTMCPGKVYNMLISYNQKDVTK
jgi:hypothetical protein